MPSSSHMNSSKAIISTIFYLPGHSKALKQVKRIAFDQLYRRQKRVNSNSSSSIVQMVVLDQKSTD